MVFLTERTTPREPTPNHVPRISLDFWIVQILAVTLGETAADYLSVNLELGLATSAWVISVLLASALIVQLTRHRYVPGVYWVTLVLISIAGTLAADVVREGLGIDPRLAFDGFAIAVMATFVAWYIVECTVSIVSITTIRRECFYWIIVLFTFSLGATSNDLLSEFYQLGYVIPVLIWIAAIGLVAALSYGLGLGKVRIFWATFALICPLGSSLGDLLSEPFYKGGLGFGTAAPSLIFVTVITAFIPYMTVTRDEARIRFIRFDFQ